MFLVKNTESPIEIRQVEFILNGTFSFKMQYFTTSNIVILITRFGDTITQINIFSIHKEVFVKSFYFLIYASFNKHKSACQYIDFCGGFFLNMIRIIILGIP